MSGAIHPSSQRVMGLAVRAVVALLGFGIHSVQAGETNVKPDQAYSCTALTSQRDSLTNGKFGNVFGGVSQAFSSDTSHVFSATSKTDGQFNADIDVSKKTDADIQSFISMGGMMQGQSRLRDAESAYFVAAKIAKNLHGAESVEYAKAIDGLAFMYFGVCTEAYVAKKNSRSSEERNACETADRQFQQVIGIYDKKLGVSSQEANAARDSYASMLEILDKQNEATQVRKQIVSNPAPVQPPVAAPVATPTTGNLPAFSQNEGYAAVRQKMLAAGWQPFHAPDADVCSAGDARCQGRPEMQICAGTGMANCRFLWQKDGKTIAVMTVGEDAAFAGIEPLKTSAAVPSNYVGVVVAPREQGDQYTIKLASPVVLSGDADCGQQQKDEIELWDEPSKLKPYAGKSVAASGQLDCPRGGYVLRSVTLSVR